MPTSTELLHTLRAELAKRLQCEVSAMAHSGHWHLYKGQPPTNLVLLAGPLSKRELISWLTGAGFGFAHKKADV